jgi:ABC-type lipoprotein export system ATPase subunit/GNAT superfamily N-acetyltransferase
MKIDVTVESEVSASIRARQVSAMFDVPPSEKTTLRWQADLPIESTPWNVGLIVGPSGSGKSTITKSVFGTEPQMAWGAKSVIDDFAAGASVADIADVCQAVGFNTIPAWLRPFAVLSNGEKFRVDLARRVLELPDPIVVDEFTSVVDRQVAKIGSHAVQKFVRKRDRRFVAVTCHYDVLDWLQPDWVFDVATMSFTRRLLQRRPSIECVVGRVPYAAWRVFSPFHYLTADLHRAATCFGLWAGDRLAAFAAMLHRPHARVDDIIMGCSRLVTLPDFQGCGLAMALIDRVAAAYRGIGKRVHTYPAHPSLIRTFDRSKSWALEHQARYSSTNKRSSTLGSMGGRPNACFSYAGPAMDPREAERLIAR